MNGLIDEKQEFPVSSTKHIGIFCLIDCKVEQPEQNGRPQQFPGQDRQNDQHHRRQIQEAVDQHRSLMVFFRPGKLIRLKVEVSQQMPQKKQKDQFFHVPSSSRSDRVPAGPPVPPPGRNCNVLFSTSD